MELPPVQRESRADPGVTASPGPELLEDQVADAIGGQQLAQDEELGIVSMSARVDQADASSSASGRLLAIRFDLSDPSGALDTRDASEVLEARKNVRLNGVDVGSTAIRVTSGSALFVARDELQNLLDASGQKDRAEQVGALERSGRFVSFDDMRRLGFGVRYDPVTDRILIST